MAAIPVTVLLVMPCARRLRTCSSIDASLASVPRILRRRHVLVREETERRRVSPTPYLPNGRCMRRIFNQRQSARICERAPSTEIHRVPGIMHDDGALVLGVHFASASRREMCGMSSFSISTNIGVAPTYSTAFTVATKVSEGTST